MSSPDRLSPLPVAGELVELPWGLDWATLATQLPRWAGGSQARASHRIQGLHGEGNSQILTLTHSGRCGEVEETIFCKLTQPGDHEAAKYRAVQAQQGPVPQLLASAQTQLGEVIVLEFLATIGTTAEQVDSLLTVIAELNLLPVLDDPLFEPRPGNPHYLEQIAATLHRLLPSELADRVLADYLRWADQVRRLPTELNHNELSYQQLGWTASEAGRPSRLVVFDLQTLARLPRFTDLAGMLADLADQSGRSQRELFASHLAARERLGAAALDADQAWEELLQVRVIRTAEALPWYEQQAGNHGIPTAEQGLTQLVADLAALTPG